MNNQPSKNQVPKEMVSKDSREDYLHLSFERWRDNFKGYLHDNIILDVPSDVLKYLKSDVMVLPQDSMSSSKNETSSNSIWSANEVELEGPNFSEFDEKLKRAIERLGGKVFIKLNWSAPKDASWITSTRSLCCSDKADIYLLLKSSSYISDDISRLTEENGFENNLNKCYLVLKKWEEIHPGTEFRGFVINKTLVGVCQRDGTSYFKYIKESKRDILESIVHFFSEKVKNNIPIDDYAFDLVVLPNKKIIMLDFGILNKESECLMFSYLDLKRKVINHNSEDFDEVEFRFIDEDTNVTQSQCKHYGIPIDVVHFCSEKKTVLDFIEDRIIHDNS